MNSRPLIYWESARLDRCPPVRLLTRRAMILPQAHGKLGETPQRSEITLAASVLDKLEAGDVMIIGPVPAELTVSI